ncbi:GntR family transcriptional regulator [Aidingimonas lacisalsi]|uniref:GntR family transcriptional regulator n=1 Tax=Aidingimonas lacisalsi TaxID=2604086 RepID=UPI0011D2115A|nr:GntR family transcriptional regulator [Aidingimonas lacisalsi]
MTSRWQEELSVSARGTGRISDQHIVDRIRHAVLTQRLPPNTRLPEVTLGEVFGVSRSVIRKALTRLASDHVIVQQPNQVARVAAPDVAETREIFAARRLVEGEVVSLLCGAFDGAQYGALETLVHAEQLAYEQGDESRRIEQSLAIHHYLADHSPNRILGVMLTDLILRTSIVIALYKRSGMTSCYLENDHADLLALLREGKADIARRHVQTHLESLENLLDLSAPDTDIDLASIFAFNV